MKAIVTAQGKSHDSLKEGVVEERERRRDLIVTGGSVSDVAERLLGSYTGDGDVS